MKAPWTGQLSAAKTGWLLALLFFGWLAFLMLPAPKLESLPVPPSVNQPSSRLVALGLPDNPDLDALPEIFALYADKAEWKDDKTVFAYWNPGSNSYSYFFEATRKNESYRFKEIPEPHDEGFFVDNPDGNSPQECPICFYKHVLVPYPVNDLQWSSHARRSSHARSGPYWEWKIMIPLEAIKPPPPELKFPPIDLEQNK